MLEVDSIRSGYGRITVLHDISFQVKKGEIVALIGSNGAGKTTTLRALSGVQPLSSGTIRFKGKLLTGSPSARPSSADWLKRRRRKRRECSGTGTMTSASRMSSEPARIIHRAIHGARSVRSLYFSACTMRRATPV